MKTEEKKDIVLLEAIDSSGHDLGIVSSDIPWLDVDVGRNYLLIGGFISALLAAALAWGLPWVFSTETAMVDSYYYFMWVLIVLLFASTQRFWASQKSLESSSRKLLWLSAAAGSVGAVMIMLSSDWEFRILADEANLLGLSMAMNNDRTYRNILEGSFYYDSFHPSVYSLDPRPALYPFFVTIFHDLLGYNPNHSFVVNLVAGGATVSAVFYIAACLAGIPAGVLAAMLMVSNPIFDLGATSSGFETLNVLFITLTLWNIYKFLGEPSGRRLGIMLFLGVATGHCRYESILLMIPIAGALLLRWRELKFDRFSWLYLFAPFLFVPYVWQRLLSALTHEVDASKPVFSISYLLPNFKQFLNFSFDPGKSEFPMNPYLSSLATMGLLSALYWLIRANKAKDQFQGTLLAFLGVGLILLLHMSCWVVDYRTVAVQRYAISYATAFALLACWALVVIRNQAFGKIAAWGLASFILAQGLAKAGHNTQGRWLTLYREYKANLGFLKQWPKSGTLFICDRPGMYAVHQYSAMSFENANKNPNGVLDGIRRKLNPNIFVEQKIYYDKPHKASPRLSSKLSLTPVFEYQNDSQYYIRISKVYIPPPLPPAPSISMPIEPR